MLITAVGSAGTAASDARPPHPTHPRAHTHTPHPLRGIPLFDEAYLCTFARHWFWRRVMGPAAQEVLQQEQFRAAAWRAAGAAGEAGGDIRKLAAYYDRIGV